MAKRRGANEGTIGKRKDGRWQGRVNLGYDTDGKRLRKTVYGTTQHEVQAKIEEAKRAQRQGLPVLRDERLTVRQFLTDWLEGMRPPTVRPKTYASYEQTVRLYLVPALGRHRLTTLTPEVVQRLLNQKRDDGLAPNSVRTIRAVLRKALNDAEKWGRVPRNVARLATPPKAKHREMKALSPAQARVFLDAAREHRLGALFSVAVALGLRQGEILGLRWGDVDLEQRALTVRAAMQRVKGQGLTFVDLKSDRSRRVVDLPLVLVHALRAHRARQREERLKAGPVWRDHGLVFPTRLGTPLDGPNVTKYFQRLLDRAGLERLRFHDLRHSCASLCAAQGLSAHDVSRLLGHSDIRLTLNTYTHLFEEGRRRAADAMDGLFGGVGALAN